ncbi:ABC transporter permease subunit [Furfurilactobacillus milii]|uniref:ABC transporter permease subunit n=1 Tax=Furfurilactobacillus rossiae TaxID=231049 RepID=A0A7C9NTP5_9LACO|nr:ABC transporter permease subunit [Furfurilactobacillus milii]
MKDRRISVALLLPSLVGIILFLIFPVVQLVLPVIFGVKSNETYFLFLRATYNQQIIFRTIGTAFVTTLGLLVLAFPFAFWIAHQRMKVRKLLSLVILFPMLTNAVVRNFAWILILGRNGLVNTLLMDLHIVHQPVRILYTNTAIVIGLIYLFFPVMVTMLIDPIVSLDQSVDEAAAMSGAGPVTRFFKITLPQLTTSLLTGSILVFAGAMTAYTTPQLLGGNSSLVLSTLLYQQSMTLGDWRAASIVALTLILIALASLSITKVITKRISGGNEV